MDGSALNRDKWDREDYIIRTIDTALRDLNNTYQPDFHTTTSEVAEYIKANKHGVGIGIYPAVLARILLEEGDIIVAADIGQCCRHAFGYTAGVWKKLSNQDFDSIVKKRVPERLYTSRVAFEVRNAVLADDVKVSIDAFDADENIINFRNGLLDINTMELMPHSKDVLSTIQLPSDWVESESEGKTTCSYMSTLCDGDVGKERLLWQAMGVALSNIHGYKMKKALFLLGKHDSGKSQIRDLITRILGTENSSAASLKNLEDRFGTVNVYGKRVVGTSDMSYASIEQLAMFKQLTGGDTIDVEYKGQTPFSYKFKWLIWFGANEMPKFGGDKGVGVYERMMIVKCDNVIPPDKRDAQLIDKMMLELPYILRKAVEGARQVISNGYKYDIPDSVKAEIGKYMVCNDNIHQFAEECFTYGKVAAKDRIRVSMVYAAYAAWCRDSGEKYVFKKSEFAKVFEEYLENNLAGQTVMTSGIKSYAQLIWTVEGERYKNYL
jgi:P4 family phage/plasmid primase-like protien